jgi:SAM-dependent methyltransferase
MRRGLAVAGEYGYLNSVFLAAYEFFYEAKFRSNTSRMIDHDQLDLEEGVRQHANIYLPSPYYFVHKSFKWIDPQFDSSIFIDFGCGLGRVLLYASQFPFLKVIGIEAAPSLSSAAAENLEDYYGRRQGKAPDWEIVHSDAGRYQVPDRASVFFFNDPFDETVLAPVVENIIASQSAAPRRVFAIYLNPAHPEVFSGHGFETVHADVNEANKGYIVYRK